LERAIGIEPTSEAPRSGFRRDFYLSPITRRLFYIPFTKNDRRVTTGRDCRAKVNRKTFAQSKQEDQNFDKSHPSAGDGGVTIHLQDLKKKEKEK
jgi:hypothetical protein